LQHCGRSQFAPRKYIGHKKNAAAFQPPQWVETSIFSFEKIGLVNRLEDQLQRELNLA
jgi:hypothetical protein